MASVVDGAGKPGERHAWLIHSILARREERLAATVDGRATDIGDRLCRIEALLESFVQLYLVQTPEVPEDQRPTAVAGATRRWTNYQAAVAERVADAGTTAADDGDEPDAQG